MLIARELWNSKIPIRIHYEKTSKYTQISRISYLLIAFQDLIPATTTHPYFTDKNSGEALKWHLPISVLHDIHNSSSSPSSTQIVWEIILHTPETASLYPPSLLNFDAWQEATRYQVAMMAKAADQVRNRGDTIAKLTPQQKETRWQAVEKADFELFWQSSQALFESSTNKLPIFVHDGKGCSRMTVSGQLRLDGERVVVVNGVEILGRDLEMGLNLLGQ